MRSLMLLACAGCAPVAQAPGAPAPPALESPADPAAQPPSGAPADPSVDPAADGDPAAASDAADPAFRAPGRKPRPRAPAISSEAQALVDAHNRVRAKHCAGALAWSPKLAQVAQQWANALRDKGCAFGHSGGTYGENLAAGTSGVLDAGEVVGMWYDEVSHYRFPDGGFSAKTGHFTQVVWRGTTHVGCGRSQCKGLDIWVCEYSPAGNWEGQYRQNVLPTGCKR